MIKNQSSTFNNVYFYSYASAGQPASVNVNRSSQSIASFYINTTSLVPGQVGYLYVPTSSNGYIDFSAEL